MSYVPQGSVPAAPNGPVITQKRYIMKLRPTPPAEVRGVYDSAPVGHVISWAKDDMPGPEWFEPGGEWLTIYAYSPLYDVIGDSHCPRMVRKKLKFWRLRRFFRIRHEIEVPNPECHAGHFKLPDFKQRRVLMASMGRRALAAAQAPG